ncbi:unnamed protein product [Hymenolepis diminuta]|uniref:Uncharacterized protein n=1 Tax=Hymenolepis diminuta TaxID=6216 RepID=A0A564Y389_HYMDI|nr:unnamed protein product [Hymenolepis diminuta]
MIYKMHLFKMQTVSSRAEYRRIKKFLAQTSTGQIFKVIARSAFHIKFKILPHPEGQCLIIINKNYPQVQPVWEVTMGTKRTMSHEKQVPIRAKTLLQAFVLCLFVTGQHLGIDIPQEAHELDPAFISQLQLSFSQNPLGFQLHVKENY